MVRNDASEIGPIYWNSAAGETIQEDWTNLMCGCLRNRLARSVGGNWHCRLRKTQLSGGGGGVKSGLVSKNGEDPRAVAGKHTHKKRFKPISPIGLTQN